MKFTLLLQGCQSLLIAGALSFCYRERELKIERSIDMKLVQPAVYENGGAKWIKLGELFAIAKQEFGMEPIEVWSDLKEWQKPKGGYVWTTDGGVMHYFREEPKNVNDYYIPEIDARHFFEQASAGVRLVRFNPERKGHEFHFK